MSIHWRQANVETRGEQYEKSNTGHFPALIKTLWKTARQIWLQRNLLQHGNTPEERAHIRMIKLTHTITKLYRDEQHTVSYLNKKRLSRIRLEKRTTFKLTTNERWLGIIKSAQRLKTRQEETLKNKIPLLTTYQGYMRTSTTTPKENHPEVQIPFIQPSQQTTLNKYIKRRETNTESINTPISIERRTHIPEMMKNT